MNDMIKSVLSRYTPNEWLILLLFLTAFIHVYVMVALLVLVPVYFFATGQAKKALPKGVGDWLLIAFSLLAALSTFLYAKDALWDAATQTDQLKGYYLKVLSVLIVILSFDVLFLTRILTRRSLLDGLKLCTAMSYVCFAVALVQKALGLYAGTAYDRVGRVASVFHNENYYGVAIECLVPIAIFLFLCSSGWKRKIFYAGAILADLAGLWLSQCRTAFLVTGLVALLFLCIYDKRFLIVSAALVSIGVLAFYLIPSVLPRFDSLKENLFFRAGIWRTAFQAFLEKPIIGRGYFSYSGIWESYGSGEFRALHAHNMYLEVLLNFGIAGAFGLFGYGGIQVVKSAKACKGRKNRIDLALILSLLAALLLHGVLDTTFFWPQTGVFFAMILAGSAAYPLTAEHEQEGINV